MNDVEIELVNPKKILGGFSSNLLDDCTYPQSEFSTDSKCMPALMT